jgi:integrating conjugative element protein (TIGR03765 family)
MAMTTPFVLHDAGGTEPIAPYLAPYLEPVDPPEDPIEWPTPQGLDWSDLLPVTSPNLQPGRLAEDASLEVRARLRGLSRPLCLVGSDRQSLAWLSHHAVTLEAIGAACLAVEVPDRLAWEAVLEAGRGVPLIPVSGSDLAQQWGLSVYPVLITPDGFEQ